jgi:hypothetical protein
MNEMELVLGNWGLGEWRPTNELDKTVLDKMMSCYFYQLPAICIELLSVSVLQSGYWICSL